MLNLLGVDLAKGTDTTVIGFYNPISGYHRENISFFPNEDRCGECCSESCEQCKNYAQNKSV